jgi:diguanylate cyclase (GGDEF)-like protein
MRITYRGLRRIEELRELLKRDRILEREGILLDMRYFYSDLQDALQRSSDTVVSVLRLDMDDFKAVNNLGHAAGDEVMRNYLQTVKDTLGSLGDSYRGVGDEVACVIVGQEEKRVFEIAEGIRGRIEQMECKYKGTALPRVTVSIGIATTPPAAREMGLDDLADSRQLLAKKNGKNRIVTTG